ncbi:divalent-cation tolerance protein CutA [Hydrogenophaga sp. NFH-34]|uniref:divalent-cation tolerance protein CutA n=1 Tax=Hydrogenophaga sp. NFH-34 TaxID=2744446 RepID=UPI001F3B52CA|nr:divalent-cation tolerance protein CutA [Hydrogenophaga sp. NFH-34]
MFVEINSTCPTKEEAQRIARLAVEARLCACAHIYPVDSVYRWKGDVVVDQEFVVSMKTNDERAVEIEALVKREHSYELPAFFKREIIGGSAEYMRWIAENSK